MKSPKERETIHRIRDAVHTGRLPKEFTPTMVNKLLNTNWAGVFLPKHRVGNPGGYAELFVRIGKGMYRIKSD